MSKPLAGADAWASSARRDTGSANPPDTIDRVISRRVPADPPSRPVSAPVPAAPRPPAPTRHPTAAAALPAFLFAANRELSGSAVKILLAVMEAGENIPISRAEFKQMTRLSGDHAVLNAIQECIAWEWLMRRYTCPLCQAPLSDTREKMRLTDCAECGKRITPQAGYQITPPDGGMPKEHTGVSIQHTGMPDEQTGVSNRHTGTLNEHTPGVLKEPTGGMSNQHTAAATIEIEDEANAFSSKLTRVLKKHTGVPIEPTSRMRADSESNLESRNDSESRLEAEKGTNGLYSQGRGEGKGKAGEEWKQTTEQMAQYSCRELEDGQGSLGFHITVWNHARKLDKQAKTGRPHTDALFNILRELAHRRKETSQAQGKAWTRRTRKYFDEQGQPLLTKAEQAEQKELHATWSGPPAL